MPTEYACFTLEQNQPQEHTYTTSCIPPCDHVCLKHPLYVVPEACPSQVPFRLADVNEAHIKMLDEAEVHDTLPDSCLNSLYAAYLLNSGSAVNTDENKEPLTLDDLTEEELKECYTLYAAKVVDRYGNEKKKLKLLKAKEALKQKGESHLIL